jgi:hypothetical protein
MQHAPVEDIMNAGMGDLLERIVEKRLDKERAR